MSTFVQRLRKALASPRLVIWASADRANPLAKDVSTSPTLTSGSGAPTHTEPQGSLYLRTDGASPEVIIYANTDGSTTWAPAATAEDVNANQFVEVNTVTASGGGGGATAGTLAVNVRRYSGADVNAAVTLLIVATDSAYSGPWGANGHVTFSNATTGTLVASGSGWALIQTDADGAFGCALANSSDETVHFAGCTAVGVNTLANGVVVVRSVSGSATWAP